MTFLESDVPVQAPRLLDLSAEFVANNLVEIFPIKTNDNDNDNDDNVGNDNEQQQHDVHMDGSTNDNCANYNNIITNADDGGSGNNGNHSNNGGGFESKDECDMEIDEELCGDNANVRREKCDIEEDLVLPLPCSTATLSALRKKWIQTGITPTNALRRFASKQLPLDELVLCRAHLSDRLLADLIIANKSRLVFLDISDVQGLVGHEFNRLMEENSVFLERLLVLRMTSFEILVIPSAAVPQRKHGVICIGDGNGLPVLSVEDLAHSSISIPYMECDDPPTNLNCNSDQIRSVVEFESFTSRCPNIESLTLQRRQGTGHREDFESVNEFLRRVLSPLKRLKKLDLSQWQRVDDLHAISFLSLTVLILYDVPDLYRALDTIVQLVQLKFLDLSQSSKGTGIYPRPVTALNRIVSRLPNLTHLDISSTNLAAQPSSQDRPPIIDGSVRSDIYGLRCLNEPLEYLGLFNCDSASHFMEIPAKFISGDKDENQILLALEMYCERAGLLQGVLNESYQLYRFGHNLSRHSEALHLVLKAMRRHLEDSTLQIAGSASLFYIIRKVIMNRDTKRKVVTTLLNGMDAHMEEQVMVRNCCLSLCQFEIPLEILFDYNRVARLLVAVLQHHSSDHLTQRIVVFLLNSMACHVEGEQKVQVGNLGAIEVILEQIQRKLAAGVCDDVMEVGWSFLWNITDETPTNCERFLAADGLRLFHQCYQQFQNETELVRNMMGLIGNIAEVEYLRCQLMNDDYINIFCALLNMLVDGIEISYNSAGVLAHMVSDGDVAWISVSVSREHVMARIIEATANWALNARRFINYRSFKPILRLIPMFDSPASQHWAIWALANLTSTDSDKYCSYVIKEGGVPLLQMVVDDNRSSSSMRSLALTVLSNIEKWNKQSTS